MLVHAVRLADLDVDQARVGERVPRTRRASARRRCSRSTAACPRGSPRPCPGRRSRRRPRSGRRGAARARPRRSTLRLVAGEVDHAVRDHDVDRVVGERNLLDVALEELDVRRRRPRPRWRARARASRRSCRGRSPCRSRRRGGRRSARRRRRPSRGRGPSRPRAGRPRRSERRSRARPRPPPGGRVAPRRRRGRRRRPRRRPVGRRDVGSAASDRGRRSAAARPVLSATAVAAAA